MEMSVAQYKAETMTSPESDSSRSSIAISLEILKYPQCPVSSCSTCGNLSAQFGDHGMTLFTKYFPLITSLFEILVLYFLTYPHCEH